MSFFLESFDIFGLLASGVGVFDLNSSLRGRDMDAFLPGSMSNPLLFPKGGGFNSLVNYLL